MTKENISIRNNFANEVLLFNNKSLYNPKIGETLYKQGNGSWIVIDKLSGDYINAHPDFEKTLDNIQQIKLRESNI